MKKNIVFILVVFIFAELSYSQTTYSLYKQDGKYGIINQERKIVVPAEYLEIKYNGTFLLRGFGGYKILDNDCELLYEIPSLYKVTQISSSYYQVSKNVSPLVKNEGLNDYLLNIHTNEKFPVNTEFLCGNEDDGVWFAAKFSYYSVEEKFTKKTESYSQVYPYRNGRAVIWNDDVEIIDEDFNPILTDIHASAITFSEGLLPVVMQDGRSGFVNADGEFVINCKLFVKYRINGNKEESPLVYGQFVNDRAVIQISENIWKIIDKEGKIYDFPEGCNKEADSFSNERLLVSKSINGSKRYGYLNKDCKVIIPFLFSYADSFINDYGVITFNDKEGILNKNGNMFFVDELIR